MRAHHQRVQKLLSKKVGEFRFHEKMTLLVALLAQNSFFVPFWPSGPIFLPKLSTKCPNMMVGHVVGPHWYLHKIPRSSNRPTEAIFVDPICQSRPKMGQIMN